jgi:hypothetical protein
MPRIYQYPGNLGDIVFWMLAAVAIGYAVIAALIWLDSRTGLLDPLWRACYWALAAHRKKP